MELHGAVVQSKPHNQDVHTYCIVYLCITSDITMVHNFQVTKLESISMCIQRCITIVIQHYLKHSKLLW